MIPKCFLSGIFFLLLTYSTHGFRTWISPCIESLHQKGSRTYCAFSLNRRSSFFRLRRWLITMDSFADKTSDRNQEISSLQNVTLEQLPPTENIPLFDAHCHLQLSDDDDGIESLLSEHRIALMATRPEDWERTLSIYKRHPDRFLRFPFTSCVKAAFDLCTSCSVVACLGLHPWYAHDPGDAEWLPRLRHLLLQHPAVAVGEIGLDRQWVPPGCAGLTSSLCPPLAPHPPAPIQPSTPAASLSGSCSFVCV
jgi:hypothetical protein